MKLKVNFDLLSKIATSKTGFTLDRTMKKSAINVVLVEALCLPIQIASNYTPEQFLASLLRTIAIQIFVFGTADAICSKWQKQMATDQLRILTIILKELDINTNYDLLVQSYKYKTNYKLEYNDSKIPKIKQEKYIMLPVYEDGEEREVSILQEHIIGGSGYELSIGEPQTQKKLKLVKNTI